ncbi:hypothetical protein ACGF07_34575 [Kitasatospora sp. NPDC048194]|uniref:hypothetical protein n=1 Tax=Kitasatospora sp. NPDC048194 TaxID=3364045 RepID=UPI00371D411B
MASLPIVPLPDELFDAPLPAVAYANEPDAVELDLLIDRLQIELDDWRTSHEVRLLQAVVLDLHALQYPEDELLRNEAVAAGWLLRELDDSLGTSTGKHRPFIEGELCEWDAAGGSRAYVRQEYLQYRVEQTARVEAELAAAAAKAGPPADVEPVRPRDRWWVRLLDRFFVGYMGCQRIE